MAWNVNVDSGTVNRQRQNEAGQLADKRQRWTGLSDLPKLWNVIGGRVRDNSEKDEGSINAKGIALIENTSFLFVSALAGKSFFPYSQIAKMHQHIHLSITLLSFSVL